MGQLFVDDQLRSNFLVTLKDYPLTIFFNLNQILMSNFNKGFSNINESATHITWRVTVRE